MLTNQQLYAPSLTPEQWVALSIPERALLRAAYLCDKDKLTEDPPYQNRSARLDALESKYGHLGDPWCGLFVGDNFVQSGAELDFNIAGVHVWYAEAQHRGALTSSPVRGDVYLLLFTPTTGHMGQYAHQTTPPAFQGIEGNTNTDGSREGWEVARHDRSPSPNMHFISMEKFLAFQG